MFEDKIVTNIDQGVIFNGCKSVKYDCELYGLIITPRCDISNRKVETIHYLPIVDLNMWMYKDGFDIFKTRTINNIANNINNFLKSKMISANLLGRIPKNILMDSYLSKISESKQKIKIIDSIDDYYNLISETISNDEKNTVLLKYEKIVNHILEDLVSNELSGYYILDLYSYKIVLLREVKSLSFDLAKTFCIGTDITSIQEDVIEKYDIYENPEDGFISAITKLKSPFIEHLLQQFFHCFGRIGIDGINKEDISKIKEKLYAEN